MIEPHGKKLVSKVATNTERNDLEREAQALRKIPIHDRSISDCEMIAIGGYSPLEGFLTRKEALSVAENLHLTDGTLWGFPILLPISENDFAATNPGEVVALVDSQQRIITTLKVEEKFNLDLQPLCSQLFKTADSKHPGVAAVLEGGNFFLGGPISKLIHRPKREDIAEKYFLDPQATREAIQARGWKTVVAFQTRNPIHRAHEYLIKCAQEAHDGVLIHPLVGETKKDDIPAHVRMQCYESIVEHYFNPEKTLLSVLPATMRYAGPREAIHHMIMRKNYGCTHMIIGRDHAGVGDYYGTYEAQETVNRFQDELEISAIKFEHTFFCKRCENLASQKTCPHGKEDRLFLSGTKVRQMLQNGEPLPKEFTRHEVGDILMKWGKK